ncbi:ATP phosphoribosyltransferase [Streptomyces rubradiris]|uniref:ATP phosphoribosyltransferase n=1 Tax=Streptomyces rubradiris TaxID=285531 RepID=A0ABQ3R452_STRRR|nr:ATP phosphoribosyltransferase [Streptomyces rubradiris]GHH05523.1 ATP phosphoribosyltransferase [Streptomyces rubradiris]GHI50633.1 ATP phosphoribosyltransferase [Streptomyces rubradiris]
MVSLALPTGSLEAPTLELLAAADLPVSRHAPRAYRATVGHPAVDRVVFYKPREIPGVVAGGTCDIGLTGADWVAETGAKVEVVDTLDYSKSTRSGWRVVLAVPEDHPARTVADLADGVRVATEYPALAREYFRRSGVRAAVLHSHGTTEAKIPDLADAVVEVVETGSSLRQNNLRVLDTVRRCGVNLVANPSAWADRTTRATIRTLATLLRAAYAGPLHRLLTIVLPVDRWAHAEPLLPPRWWRLDTGAASGLVVLQGVCAAPEVAGVVSSLVERAGAIEIVETPIRKLIRDHPA